MKKQRRKGEDIYQLTVTKTQAQVIQRACEIAMRLGLGQLDYITDHIHHLPRLKTPKGPYASTQMEDMYTATEKVRRLLDEAIFAASGWKPGASYGIGSPELPATVTIAADIRDVIRHRLAYDALQPGDKPGSTVDFNTPMGWGNEPLVDICKLKKREPREKAKPSREVSGSGAGNPVEALSGGVGLRSP